MNKSMEKENLIESVKSRYDGLVLKEKYSENSFFYNPDNKLKHGAYFLTIKSNDGPNDKSSNLDRDKIYRVSFNPGEEIFHKLFGEKPNRPVKGGVVEMDYDFSKTNTLFPHPVYAWMGWVCILSPDSKWFETNWGMIDKAYKISKFKYLKRMKAQ